MMALEKVERRRPELVESEWRGYIQNIAEGELPLTFTNNFGLRFPGVFEKFYGKCRRNRDKIQQRRDLRDILEERVFNHEEFLKLVEKKGLPAVQGMIFPIYQQMIKRGYSADELMR